MIQFIWRLYAGLCERIERAADRQADLLADDISDAKRLLGPNDEVVLEAERHLRDARERQRKRRSF